MKEAFSRVPNYEVVLKTAYQYGIFNLLEHCFVTPGIPLKPMLANPTKSIGEVLIVSKMKNSLVNINTMVLELKFIYCLMDPSKYFQEIWKI